jgi:aryl carrier-like protein
LSRWTGWEQIDVCGLDAALNPMGHGRGAELHLGSIVREMKVAAGENVSDIPGEQPWLRAQVGFLWEAAIEYVTAGMTIDDGLDLAFKRHMRALRSMSRQVKLVRDGIHMTPDGIDGPRLMSWKATWRGAGKAATLADFEDNFWTWQVQEKAYAAAAQEAGLLPAGDATCRFEVLWVRGDYRGAGGPKALATEVTWSAEELAVNWSVVVANRDRVLSK